jgi:hypothetical protein
MLKIARISNNKVTDKNTVHSLSLSLVFFRIFKGKKKDMGKLFLLNFRLV